MTLSVMTFNIMTLSIMTFSKMTFNLTINLMGLLRHSVGMTFSITTLSINI